MIRTLLAPRWLAWHAALVAVLVAFIWLGSWQVDSFAESGRRQAAADARGAAPLTSVLVPGQRLPADLVGRTVTATGRYDEDQQLLVPARPLDGRDGFLVVTPLRTDRGILPVNRGWVATPDDAATEATPAEVTVTGVVQPSESARDSQVDALAALPADQIPYLATVQVLDALPLSPDELYDGYVVLSSQRPAAAVAPQPVEPRALDDGVGKWRNLGYGLQWWLFAAAAVFFWAAVIRRSLREQREPHERRDEAAPSAEPAR